MPNQINRLIALRARPQLVSETTASEKPANRSGRVDPSNDSEPKASERRTEQRYPAQEPAELECLLGALGPIYGTILDVSRSGLRIALPRRVDRGEHVKVRFQQSVIFGEVRYCRAVSGVFHTGIRIQDLVHPEARQDQHLTEDALSFYAVGKGLAVSEVIAVRQHLARCETCRVRVAEKEALLNPRRKSKPGQPAASEPRA